MLADDVQAGIRHQVVDVGDAAGHRVLDRDHAERGLAGTDRGEGIFEGGAGQRLAVGIGVAEREVRVGARLALEHDLLALMAFRYARGLAESDLGLPHPEEGRRPSRRVRRIHPYRVRARRYVLRRVPLYEDRASSRAPFEICRRVDAERHAIDDGGVDAHAGLERAQLLEPFALLERRRAQSRRTARARRGGKA